MHIFVIFIIYIYIYIHLYNRNFEANVIQFFEIHERKNALLYKVLKMIQHRVEFFLYINVYTYAYTCNLYNIYIYISIYIIVILKQM